MTELTIDTHVEKHRMKEKKNFHRIFFNSTVLYLLLPNLLFFATWFRTYWAVLLFGLASLVWISIWKFRLDTDLQIPTVKQHLLIAFAALFICWFSGIGGFHFQGDHIKHYSMLYDLVYKDWPVVYDSVHGLEGPQHLNYYFAYFLPPAALAKITHPNSVDNWIILWSFLGLYLAFLWFVVLGKTKHVFWPLCFLLFLGGQDYLYAFIKLNINGFLGDKAIAQSIFEQEVSTVCVFHNTILRYPTNFFAISWAPQHIIGAWLATALLYYIYTKNKGQQYVLFILCLMPLWSVFNVAGFLPIIAAMFFKHRNFTSWISWENGIGILLGFFVLSFFLSHHSISDSGFIWQYIEWDKLFYKWPVFLLFEFLYIALAIYYFAYSKIDRFMFYSILLFMSLIPIFVLGNMNDLLMRAVVPSLFLLSLLAYQAFQGIKSHCKYFLMILVFAGVVLPQAISIAIHFPGFLKERWQNGFASDRVRIGDMGGLNKLAEEAWFNTQYFGDNRSFYFLHLSTKKEE